MYEVYWQLSRKPFGESASPELFFPAETHKAALNRLSYVVKENKGMALMVGASGVGKTITLNRLLTGVDATTIRQCRIVNPMLSDGDLLMAMVRQFNIKVPSTDKATLYEALQRQFMLWAEKGMRPLILIEDAHLIVGRRELQLLQTLLPIAHEGQPVVTMILSGSPYIYRRIGAVRGLNERVAMCASLTPLPPEEVGPYVRHLVTWAGGSEEIFTDGAIVEIDKRAAGFPRRINRLAELALVAGAAYDASEIDEDLIRNVSQELVVRAA